MKKNNPKAKKAKNTGPRLYNRAKKIIPGGTMLLSKRPEMFAPDIWPSYFSKAKGIDVWDLDGVRYKDFSIMGIGTNILGYGRDEVDQAVIETVRSGNMSTLNCPEEVYLAEELIKMNPWSSMVRFARTGGEANSISIRIARAATGKDKIAICGYHGWHDWYLSANLAKDKSLDGHLLPGLEPLGVPRGLSGTSMPFNYGDIDALAKIVESNELAAVKMEVCRSTNPDINFLKEVRSITKKHNIVLIFDECTSGFRECYGGIYKKTGVEPDLVMYGKTLGNGYGITAVVGIDDVMSSAEKTFISSTFWTERIGPSAALKTLEIMKKEKPWIFINQQAKKVRRNLLKIAKKNNLDLTLGGLPVLTNFSINHPEWLKIKTYITQEALKNQMLISNSFYISSLHNDEALQQYFEFMESIFQDISNHLSETEFHGNLHGNIAHSGFQRLN